MLDIILINLPTSSWYKKELNKSTGMPPLGLLYIATMLDKAGYKVSVLDFCVTSMTEEVFEKYIKEHNPSMIGLSTYSESWLSLQVISEKIKSINEKIKVVAGGAFATFIYKDILNQTLVDIVSMGEGEYSLLGLCNVLIRDESKMNEIQGIAYKENNNIIDENAMCKRIINLDDLPYPDRKFIDISDYGMPFTISTARGCPGQCIFCSSRAFWGTKVYMRSAKSIYDEIMYLYHQYHANYFQIADDTFTASKKRAIDVCNMLNQSGVKFIWGCESRADVIDEEFIKILHDSGCNKIQIGLESADNNILKLIKKNVTIEQIEQAIKLAHKYGMYITLSFIIGHAFDTKESIKKTIDFATKAKMVYGANIVSSINTPFLGTEQYMKREELGIKIHSYDWDDFRLDNPNIDTKHFSLDEFRKMYMEVTELCLN